MERTYKVKTTSKTHTIKAKAAQLAVNYVYGIMGEHDEIISVTRISENGEETNCIWKYMAPTK